MDDVGPTLALVHTGDDPCPRDLAGSTMNLPDDFRDMLIALADAGASFVVIGGYAVAFHGHPRATKDIDVFVATGVAEAARIERALAEFGAPLHALGVSREDFEKPGRTVQIGLTPLRIDVITEVDGIDFADAWASRVEMDLEGRVIPVIGRDALIRNKRATARLQDLADIEALERMSDG